MKNKYYIYRNSTLEHIFKGEDCIFSSYGGVEKCDESDREIVVLYLLPYSYSENDIVAFAKEFLEKTTYIANSHPDKTIHTFSLFNYFYKPLIASNAAVEKIIQTTKKPYRLQSSQLKISKVFICNKIIYSMNNEKMLPNRCHDLNKFVWNRHKL